MQKLLKKTINFSNAYYNSAAVIIGPKGADKEFSPEHLSGKNVGVQSGTTHSNYIDKYYVPKGSVVKTYGTQDEANNDLENQASEIAATLKADGVEVPDDAEIIALIAYLQRLGKDIKAEKIVNK